MIPFPNGWRVPKQNIYSPYALHTSYGLFTSERNICSPYEWLSVQMTPRTNDSILRIYLHTSSVNKLVTWSQTDYPSSVRTDDMFPDRINILHTKGRPPFKTDDMFPNIISILHTYYILRTDSLHLNRLFVSHTNDYLYKWLPERMTQSCVYTYTLVP